MQRNWNDLTRWQRRRATEALALLVAAWYTTFNPLPDIPYGPVRLELLTSLAVAAVLSWWVVLTLAALARRVARRLRSA
jgi:Co/Zn/Cd efflux system component